MSEGAYQSGNGYSTRVSLPGYLACYPSSQREASHVSSQGEEAISVTHDIYNVSYALSPMKLDKIANGCIHNKRSRVTPIKMFNIG